MREEVARPVGLEAVDLGLDELVDGGLGEAEVEQRLAPRVDEAAARAHLLVRVRVRVRVISW